MKDKDFSVTECKFVPVELLERVVRLDNSFCEQREATRDLVGFLAASESKQADVWPRLEKPAMVGAGRFGVGVSTRLVVGAAQRLYEYEVTPEKEAQRIARARPIRFADLPAAQPQGEPGALSPARSERPNSIAKPVTRRVCHACAGLRREVFCKICDDEQPAPVVVVSGGRQTGKAHLAAQLESLAKQVYQSWESQPGFVYWVDGGNSLKQDEARRIASRTFELALANQVGD